MGPKVAQWVQEFARNDGRFEVHSTDLAELNLPILDEPAHPRFQKYEHEHTKQWSKLVESSDAFIFVTPEYDYFAPAALVNAIQFLFQEWSEKPAGIVSYGGVSGGLRSTQELRLLLANVNMMPINLSVAIPFVNQSIGEDGVFRASDYANSSATSMLNQLHRWSVGLQAMRNNK